MRRHEEELLAYVANRMGCLYISDLHFIRNENQFKEIIHSIPYGVYSKKEWMDMADYLNDNKAFQNIVLENIIKKEGHSVC